MSVLLRGHALVKEGAPHGPEGEDLNRIWGGTAGIGRAKCECGALSDELPSSPKRKAWHRGHKDAIRSSVAA